MAKDLLFGEEARRKIKVGIDKLANAVKVTLGARGRNVIMSREFTSPLITKDGVTVAREIELKDPYENMGASIIKEAAQKTNEVAGDGTTTATVLAQAIIDSGMRHIRSGHNPIEVKRGIDKAVEAVIKRLKELSKEVNGTEEIAQVGAISANDKQIGELIAKAMEEVGKTGVITVEDSNKLGLSVDVVRGMKFDKGYASQYMVTNKEKHACEVIEPHILITDHKITVVGQFVPLVNRLAEKGIKDLVVIAEDFSDDVVSTFVVNRLRGNFNVLAVKAPGFGDLKSEHLKDIATLSGAKYISEEAGMKIEDVQIADLGRCLKITSTKDDTTIIDGLGDKEVIDEYIKGLQKKIEDESSEYEKQKIKERVAKISGGVAVIKVGAPSDIEVKEIKDRIEDALNATRAAVEEGIVMGGGVTLLIASEVDVVGDNPSQQIGIDIIKEALQVPIKQIAFNAGESGDVVISKVKESKFKKGYNAHTGEYEDLFKAGVIDPTKVTRTALEKSASVASMFLTTECVIVDEPKEDK